MRDIKPAPYNPRSITPEQFDTLGKSMSEFGDISGVTFNVRTGNTVGGHQRIKQLDPEWKVVKSAHSDKTGTVALGYIETPWGKFNYREVDWDEQKEMLANIAANKIGGEFNYEALSKLLNDLDGKVDVGLTGFTHDEILQVMNGTFQPIDIEDLADPSEAINFNIRCENMKEMEKLQKRLGLTGEKTTFPKFMEALDKLK